MVIFNAGPFPRLFLALKGQPYTIQRFYTAPIHVVDLSGSILYPKTSAAPRALLAFSDSLGASSRTLLRPRKCTPVYSKFAGGNLHLRSLFERKLWKIDLRRVATSSRLALSGQWPTHYFGCPIHDDSLIVGMGGNHGCRR